ncbi:MAG: DNA recombination protein RmuC [Acidobacteria bacterium]|nr:DNA recombination protein RmuC [Acidobacteriota bacterium]
MTEIILFISGLVAGFAAAWLAAAARVKDAQAQAVEQKQSLDAVVLSKEQQLATLQQQVREEGEKKASAQADLRNAQTKIEEQRRDFQEVEKKLIDTFDALAHKALASNNQSFLELATNKLQTLQTEAKGDLDLRQQAIGGLILPLQETLTRYEQQIAQMEKHRQEAYGGLTQQLSSLQKVTGSLDSALRTPQARGSWGELALRRVVEMAGMSPYCDFTEQETLQGELGRLRPDMIVTLPAGRRIALDSKVPLNAFQDSVSAPSETERAAHLARHAKQVREHMNSLGAKSYWETLDAATDFVILFMPGESLFSAALEQDRNLIEYGWERRVLLATPTSLIAMLRSMAYGWQQEKMAQNAQQISDLGRELYTRIATFTEHMEDMRKSLTKAVVGFDRAAGSFESRVLVQARRLKELGGTAGPDIEPLDQIGRTPRLLDISNVAEESSDSVSSSQHGDVEPMVEPTSLRAAGASESE